MNLNLSGVALSHTAWHLAVLAPSGSPPNPLAPPVAFISSFREGKQRIMVARTTVTIYDDLDNSEGASTVSFTYRGTGYEIDLGQKNQAALDKALSKYIAAARKKTSRPPMPSSRGRSKARTKGRPDLTAVRNWAHENGYDVSDRGRIPGEVQDAYDAAH
jgi:hypothetical protein